MKWVVADPNSWETRYQQLIEYKAEHGDCNVPMRKDDPQLGEWVGQQRKQYKAKKEGKKAAITEERIQKLDGLGFTWQLRKRKRQTEPTEAEVEAVANSQVEVDGDGIVAEAVADADADADAEAAAESATGSLVEGIDLPAVDAANGEGIAQV